MLESHQHDTASLLAVTDTCRQAGHEMATVEREGGASPVVVRVTCTETWGRLGALPSWQEHCPCCFSEAHPNGLVDLGITARVLSAHK
jgi:hypothetical protein